MHSKILFFPSVAVEPKELPLSEIQKYIAAAIDFNKILARTVLTGTKNEVFEIMISLYLNLSELPSVYNMPTDEMFTQLKKNSLMT